MYSVVERMDDCEYSLEITIVPLKECIAEKNIFFGNKHTIVEKITQAMDGCYSFCDKNRYPTSKEGWP